MLIYLSILSHFLVLGYRIFILKWKNWYWIRELWKRSCVWELNMAKKLVTPLHSQKKQQIPGGAASERIEMENEDLRNKINTKESLNDLTGIWGKINFWKWPKNGEKMELCLLETKEWKTSKDMGRRNLEIKWVVRDSREKVR